mgnify:CR=1
MWHDCWELLFATLIICVPCSPVFLLCRPLRVLLDYISLLDQRDAPECLKSTASLDRLKGGDKKIEVGGSR